jgi:hypothetical protein
MRDGVLPLRCRSRRRPYVARMPELTSAERSRLLAFALLLILPLAACSPSDGSVGSPIPTDSASAAAPTAIALPASSFLMREYYGHARYFSMARSGHGMVGWRATHECFQVPPPTPCYGDPNRPGGKAPLLIRSVTEDAASGFVLSTTEPDVFDVGAVTFRWDGRTDVLTATDRHGSIITFCGPQNRGTCGL